MSATIVKILKGNIRQTESELSNWKIEQARRQSALDEANKMVGILNAGLDLLKLQLESTNVQA